MIRPVRELFHRNFDLSREPSSFEILSPKSFKMNPDPEFVGVVFFSRGFLPMNPLFLKRLTPLLA